MSRFQAGSASNRRNAGRIVRPALPRARTAGAALERRRGRPSAIDGEVVAHGGCVDEVLIHLNRRVTAEVIEVVDEGVVVCDGSQTDDFGSHRSVRGTSSSVTTVADPDGDPVSVSIRVYSDETEIPDTGDGTGRHAPDYKTQLASGATGHFLRSERRGPEDGRFYIGVIRADDGNGGVTEQVCVLAVCPHDQNNPASLDDVLNQANTAAAALNFPTGLYEHGLSAPLGPNQ